MAPFQLKEALGLFVQRCGFYYQFPLVAIWPRLPTLTLILKRNSAFEIRKDMCYSRVPPLPRYIDYNCNQHIIIVDIYTCILQNTVNTLVQQNSFTEHFGLYQRSPEKGCDVIDMQSLPT